jgi:two-component system sensor histidine kinase EvgS
VRLRHAGHGRLAFARAVRARKDACGGVPAIGCTASAVAADHAAALAAGMNAVIVKPVGLQVLDAAVAKACASGCRARRVAVPVQASTPDRQAGTRDEAAHCGVKPGSRSVMVRMCAGR